MIFEVFKRTWKEVRKERDEAKKAREEVEILLRQAKNTVLAINKAYEYLKEIYLCLPEDDRKNYVQKTLDLLKSAHSFYNKLYEDYSSDYDLRLMYLYWEAKDWKNVVVVCERLKRNINNSRKIYVETKKETKD